MRFFAFVAAVMALTAPACAQYYGSNPNSHYVQGHTNNNGTYVGGHYQTNPNNSTYDNYDTPGNYNPHTGQTAR